MSHGLESPASQAPLAANNIIPMGSAETARTEARRFAIETQPGGFVSGGLQGGSEQWFQSFLSQLGPGETLSLRVAFDAKGGLLFGATACAPPPTIEARVRELEHALREVVPLQAGSR